MALLGLRGNLWGWRFRVSSGGCCVLSFACSLPRFLFSAYGVRLSSGVPFGWLLGLSFFESIPTILANAALCQVWSLPRAPPSSVRLPASLPRGVMFSVLVWIILNFGFYTSSFLCRIIGFNLSILDCLFTTKNWHEYCPFDFSCFGTCKPLIFLPFYLPADLCRMQNIPF